MADLRQGPSGPLVPGVVAVAGPRNGEIAVYDSELGLWVPQESWASQQIWVNWRNSDTADGSQVRPWPTIQQAIDDMDERQDALLVPTELTDWFGFRHQARYDINVATGAYDQALAFTRGNTFVTLRSFGPVVVGDGNASSSFDSTTARNITYHVDEAKEVADRGVQASNRVPGIVFAAQPSGLASSQATQMGYRNGFKISGNIVMTEGASGTSALGLFNCDVQGAVDASALTAFQNVYGKDSKIFGQFTSSMSRFQDCNAIEFANTINAHSYAKMVACVFEGNMFFASGVATQTKPQGLYMCDFFSGGGTVLESPPNVLMDGATNYWFKTRGATLQVGTTKTIIDDLVA